MDRKSIITSVLLSLIIVVLYFVSVIYKTDYASAYDVYEVYLNGKSLGFLENKDDLYNIINNEQKNIKEEYSVSYVYPPDGLDIVKTTTFDDNFLTADELYNKMDKSDDFTIKGYIVTIKVPDKKDNLVINVTSRKVWDDAINNFVMSFISEEQYNNYVNGIRSISEIGSIISNMYFNETITIKEGFINVKNKIYTDSDELSQYLLFGPDAVMDTYKVELGDTISSISEDNQINSQEFLIANPKYKSEDALLTVGTDVNVTLINPVITLKYNVYEINENETPYSSETVVDNTKPSDYSEVTRSGVSELTLVHDSYEVVNGNQSSEVNIISREVIREMVKEQVTVGRKITRPSVSGNYVSVSGWGYPTNYPFMLTSPFGWRSHKMHSGVDISGTGFRSPVYAVADGTVVEVSYRSTDGNFIIIDQGNNLYTQYAHLYQPKVSVGQTVSKGQTIGEMGQSGLAFGVHLHFGVSVGWPFHGAYQFQNPLNYIKLK